MGLHLTGILLNGASAHSSPWARRPQTSQCRFAFKLHRGCLAACIRRHYPEGDTIGISRARLWRRRLPTVWCDKWAGQERIRHWALWEAAKMFQGWPCHLDPAALWDILSVFMHSSAFLTERKMQIYSNRTCEGIDTADCKIMVRTLPDGAFVGFIFIVLKMKDVYIMLIHFW